MSGYIGKSQSGILANPSNNTVETSDIQDNAVTPAKLSTGAPEWDTSGKVGIGTSSPAQALHIKTTADQSRWIQVQNDSTILYAGVKASGIAAIQSDDDLTFDTGSSYLTRMRIDSSGRVTIPYQPYFQATRTGSAYSINTTDFTTSAVFNYANENVGNHYNTSNGLFTAPVAGTYSFVGSSYTTDGNVLGQCWLTVNGARKNLTDWVNPSNSPFICGTFIVKLNANDTVGFHPYSAGTTNIEPNANHSWFKGYLLG